MWLCPLKKSHPRSILVILKIPFVICTATNTGSDIKITSDGKKLASGLCRHGEEHGCSQLVVTIRCFRWQRIGDKPQSEPMLTRFTDAYIRHQGRGDELTPLPYGRCSNKYERVMSKPNQLSISCRFYSHCIRWIPWTLLINLKKSCAGDGLGLSGNKTLHEPKLPMLYNFISVTNRWCVNCISTS